MRRSGWSGEGRGEEGHGGGGVGHRKEDGTAVVRVKRELHELAVATAHRKAEHSVRWPRRAAVGIVPRSAQRRHVAQRVICVWAGVRKVRANDERARVHRAVPAPRIHGSPASSPPLSTLSTVTCHQVLPCALCPRPGRLPPPAHRSQSGRQSPAGMHTARASMPRQMQTPSAYAGQWARPGSARTSCGWIAVRWVTGTPAARTRRVAPAAGDWAHCPRGFTRARRQ